MLIDFLVPKISGIAVSRANGDRKTPSIWYLCMKIASKGLNICGVHWRHSLKEQSQWAACSAPGDQSPTSMPQQWRLFGLPVKQMLPAVIGNLIIGHIDRGITWLGERTSHIVLVNKLGVMLGGSRRYRYITGTRIRNSSHRIRRFTAWEQTGVLRVAVLGFSLV